MSLGTPEQIRSLQSKLYVKAKAEPAYRYYVLYDKVCRDDILLHAYKLARANAGAPGVDGVTFAAIEEASVEAWLASLREDLVKKSYKPDPRCRDSERCWRCGLFNQKSNCSKGPFRRQIETAFERRSKFVPGSHD